MTTTTMLIMVRITLPVVLMTTTRVITMIKHSTSGKYLHAD